MRTRTVPVIMPERVWGQLATIASSEQTRIADLLVEAVENVLQKRVPDVRRSAPVQGDGNERLRQLSDEVTRARRNGYKPPRAEQRQKFTRERRAELMAEVRRLNAGGLSDLEIAKRLKIGAETARRYRVQQELDVVGNPGRPVKQGEALDG